MFHFDLIDLQNDAINDDVNVASSLKARQTMTNRNLIKVDQEEKIEVNSIELGNPLRDRSVQLKESVENTHHHFFNLFIV